MIVRCENCQTEFALDDSQVPTDGVQVRCSVCSHVFHVEPALGSVHEQPWQIRTTDDLLFTAPDLRVLEEWIRDGRLHPHDEVSRTGNAWLRLGDMPEFAQLFSGFGGLPSVLKPVVAELPGRSPDGESSAALKLLGPPPGFDERESITTGTFSRPGKSPGAGSGLRLPDDLLARAKDLEASTTPLAAERSAPAPLATMSMLGAATQAAVRPVTRAPSGRLAVPVPPVVPPVAAIERDRSDVQPAEDVHLGYDEPAKRSSWGVWAVVGVLVPIGVIFGVPQIRAKALGLFGYGSENAAVAGAQEDPAALPAELKQAEQALRTLGEADVSAAEAAIQRAIDEGAEGDALGYLQLAKVELLASRSVSLRMAASVSEDPTELERRASDDLSRARTTFATVESTAPKGDELVLARATLRLAEGRPVSEIAALLPEDAKEARLVARLAPVWRDAIAGDTGAVSGLASLPPQTALGRSALALARHRGAEPGKARTEALALQRLAPDQPVGAALLVVLGPGSDAQTGDGDETDGEVILDDPEETTGGEVIANGTGGRKPNGGGGGGGGNRLDKLLDRGCDLVDTDAEAANKALLQAFDIAPANLEVLTCLGDANLKLGKGHRALVFYKKILDRSPNHVSGLRGAARASKKIGSKADALTYYGRVLEIDKNNGEAKKYIEQAEGGGSDSGTGGDTPKPPGGEPPDPPKDTPNLDGDPG